ncbi:hypothetical protein ITP53_36180 [Nonomuraea sp. K274]|uniref:BcpO-related WXXGXW repeat protein n=1 Tax=Nonomuraea cypriaca TaxID=1187855 RepID=A0A931ADW0_9ACTN|nr:hypothetical protein [Nonomuraea cypriaca]MBF8191056.1 hypothetical protein [Nonomuraea cypriaca]
MNNITRRLATAAATLAVTGGVVFAATGAASAATTERAGQVATVAISHQAAQNISAARRWDGERWWYRYSGRDDWYTSGNGARYRFDGHRLYRWNDHKWKVVSASYAWHHHLGGKDLRGDAHRPHHRGDHGYGHDHGHGDHHDHGKGHSRHGD